MISNARKLQLIGEILKIDSEAILREVEAVLKGKKTTKSEAVGFAREYNSEHISMEDTAVSVFKEFSGIWNEEEAAEIEKSIEESCETINPDDWK